MNKLYEDLRRVDDFLKNMKHGLVVMDGAGETVHFVGYKNKPTNEDIEAVRNEIRVDESLGLTNRDDLSIVEATEDQVKFYK